MGPYPHDAPSAEITDSNPMGTDGFEFVEYASSEPEKLGAIRLRRDEIPLSRG